MKLVIKRTDFLKALNAAASIAPQKAVRPGLRNLLLSADSDLNVEVQATDLEIGLRYKLKAEAVEKPESILLPASTLAGVVGACPDEFIALTTNGAKCNVISGEDDFEILGALPEDFPDIQSQAIAGKSICSIPSAKLSSMIGQVASASAREQSRYAICGVYFESDGKKFNIVATDGSRMAVSSEELASESGNAIIATKACREIQGICNDSDLAIVEIRHRYFIVTAGNATISTLLIEGIFPKYAQAMPKKNDKVCTFKKDAMIEGLRKAVMLTSEETNTVTLGFSMGRCVIESQSASKGKARVTVKVDYNDEETSTSLNPAFLIDAVKACEEDTMKAALLDHTKPILLKSGNYQHVLMPVNKKD